MFHKISLKCLKTTAIIGVVAGSSLICTQFIIGNELEKVTKIPTTYDVSQLTRCVNRQIPKGYIKSNYKTFYCPNRPNLNADSKELSFEKAAEIASQEIFRFFGENLNNHTLEMSYYKQPANSIWTCDVKITPSYWSSVEINANTGEINHICLVGNPSVDKNFDSDAPSTNKLVDERLNLSKKDFELHREEYLKKAKYFIAQKGFLSEPIQSISYVSNSCDAFAIVSHTFEITTPSHKTYRFSFSKDLTSLRDFWVMPSKNEVPQNN